MTERAEAAASVNGGVKVTVDVQASASGPT
jgi:hypothetical protein